MLISTLCPFLHNNSLWLNIKISTNCACCTLCVSEGHVEQNENVIATQAVGVYIVFLLLFLPFFLIATEYPAATAQVQGNFWLKWCIKIYAIIIVCLLVSFLLRRLVSSLTLQRHRTDFICEYDFSRWDFSTRLNECSSKQCRLLRLHQLAIDCQFECWEHFAPLMFDQWLKYNS